MRIQSMRICTKAFLIAAVISLLIGLSPPMAAPVVAGRYTVRFTARYVSGDRVLRNVFYYLDGGPQNLAGTVLDQGDFTFSAEFSRSIRVHVNLNSGTLYHEELYINGTLVAARDVGDEGLTYTVSQQPSSTLGNLHHFDLNYTGGDPATGQGDGDDQRSVTVQPGQSLTMYFFYAEGNAGNSYIIRAYPEWNKTTFIVNSDCNETCAEGTGQEIGGQRYDAERYTVPSQPGSYKVRAVYSGGTTPPSWDRYDRLLGEYTVIASQPSDDTYEPDNSMSQAKWISSGQTQTHSIIPANDVDWVKFSLSSDSQVTLWTSGSSGDTQMWLYDSNGEELAFDDDGGDGYFSRIESSLPLMPGTYYAKVDEYGNNNAIPTYNLSLRINVAEPPVQTFGQHVRVMAVGCSSTDAYFVVEVENPTTYPPMYYVGASVSVVGSGQKIAHVVPIEEEGQNWGASMLSAVTLWYVGEGNPYTSVATLFWELAQITVDEMNRQAHENVTAFRIGWYDATRRGDKVKLLFHLTSTQPTSSWGFLVQAQWQRYRNETASQRDLPVLCR